MFENLTIITCSYNTPEVTMNMLKSFAAIHKNKPVNLVLVENSTNDDTQKLLKENRIQFIKNPGGTHSTSIDKALEACKTTYALMVDTDIIFKHKIDNLLKVMTRNDITLMGEVCGDRGGYHLKKRVHPWFCLINVDNIKKHNIKFHDQERIDKTYSQGFYGNIPLNTCAPNNPIEFYDVGATFYEDIINANLKVVHAKGITKYFDHYEGMSWYQHSGIPHFERIGKQRLTDYKFKTNHLQKKDNIDLRVVFEKRHIHKRKVAIIQPIFAPNDHILEVNLKSLKSLVKYINKHYDKKALPLQLIIGGYCKDESNFAKYEEVLKGMEVEVPYQIHKFDHNFGKSYIVNTLYRYIHPDIKWLFTADSDILFDIDEPNIFKKCIDVILLKPIIAMLAMNQKEGQCQWIDQFNIKENINGVELGRASHRCGIAGGCMFLNTEYWKKVGGYRQFATPYAGDDGFLLHDLQQEGGECWCTLNIWITHPNWPQTPTYGEFKHDSMERSKKLLPVLTSKPTIVKELIDYSDSKEDTFVKMLDDLK